MSHVNIFTAIIPAREGSKRLPNKNLKKILGKSLLSYAIDAASESEYVDQCILTTNISEDLLSDIDKKSCFIHKRLSHLSEDNVLMSDVVVDVITSLKRNHQIESEYIVLLQPTSPLRTTRDIDQACELILNSPNSPSLISVFEPSCHPHKMFSLEEDNSLIPFFDLEDLEKPKQHLSKVYAQNGAIYIARTDEFLKHKSFFIQPCLPYEMSLLKSIDIDTADDFKLAKFIFGDQN